MPEKRSYYTALAESRGYAAADSVTKDLSLLVAADLQDNSSKLVKARKLGIKIMSLEEFLASSVPVEAAKEDDVAEQPELFPAAAAKIPQADCEEEQLELF